MRGFLWDPPRVTTYYNFAWVPHTLGGGLTPPDPHPLFRTLNACVSCGFRLRNARNQLRLAGNRA